MGFNSGFKGLTDAIPLWQTMYSYSQQSKCFWNRYDVAWQCPDLNQAVTGLCWPKLYVVSGGSGIKLSNPHSTNSTNGTIRT